MTPRQARVALCSFLALAAGVTANALFLQTKPLIAGAATASRTEPRSVEDRARKISSPPGIARTGAAAADERSVRVARFKPDAAKTDSLPESPEAIADVETIRAVQRELTQRGYGPLAIDGIIRPATRAGIMAYEHDQGLALTGRASDALLKRMLLGAPAAADRAVADKVQTAEAEALIRSVQRSLALLGYRPGAADGRLNAETVRALREFELDNGFVPKGRVSAEIVEHLRLATSAPATAR
jgi:hypothetical protein